MLAQYLRPKELIVPGKSHRERLGRACSARTDSAISAVTEQFRPTDLD